MISKSLKILIVETNLANALRMQLQLEKTGHTITGRPNNSSDALELIQVAPPDLILMDTNLSGEKAGIGLAKQIRFLNIPILFTTLFGSEEEFNLTSQLNMIGYLVKPIDKFSLLSILFRARSA